MLKNFPFRYQKIIGIKVSEISKDFFFINDVVYFLDMLSFPWTISITDACIYTLQYGRKLNLLKPASISATVALTTNQCKTEETKPQSEESLRIDVNHDSGEIETFSLCVYVDISPIKMYFSEAQARF